MNKKIFITGSTGGIGKAICEKFLSENFKLILTSSSEKKIDELKKIYGDKNFYYQLNISSEESITKCTDDIINNHKDLGVIVNNAGITEDNLLLRMKSD